MADKLVTVKTFDSYIQANIAKGLLESNGIPAFVAGENAANIYTVPSIAAASLQVPEERIDEAIEILESAREGVEGDEPEFQDEQWHADEDQDHDDQDDEEEW